MKSTLSTYRQHGEGPPVVLLHGVGANKGLWPTTLETLSDHFTVYCIDLPGHGNARDQENLSLENMIISVEKTLDSLGLKSFHLVGVSLGASIAIKLTESANARVRSLFVSGVGFVPDKEIADEVYGTREALHYLTEKNFADQMGEALLIPEAPMDSVEALQSSIEQMGKFQFLNALEALAEPGIFTGINIGSPPTALMRGELDEFVSVKNAQALANRLSGSDCINLADAGHMANLDNPDGFCLALSKWLRDPE